MSLRICFVAAPLIARSGVYNSTVEAVDAARRRGLSWTAVIGVSRKASGTPTEVDGVTEYAVEPRGIGGVRHLADHLRSLPVVRQADVIISMIPQTDMALGLTSLPWIAYLRGLPWPAAGESTPVKAAVWHSLESLALRRSLEVWATTPLLAREVGGAVDRIVPPGLLRPAASPGPGTGQSFVWAARYGRDKNPSLFVDALRMLPAASGVMYGTGPLQDEVTRTAPGNVRVAGWASRGDLWSDALAYVGTSTREAFGRSAVEAAMLGIPVLVSDRFGCAEILVTDPDLKKLCVLPTDDVSAWTSSLSLLHSDHTFRERLAEHVKMNADGLTIDSAVDNISEASVAALSRTRLRR